MRMVVVLHHVMLVVHVGRRRYRTGRNVNRDDGQRRNTFRDDNLDGKSRRRRYHHLATGHKNVRHLYLNCDVS